MKPSPTTPIQWPRRSLLLLGAIAAWSVCAWTCSFGQTKPSKAYRGMTISCPRAGQIWGSPDMDIALDEVAKLGVNWIAIHPYARIQRDGTVSYRSAMTGPKGYLTRAVAKVKQRQQSMLLKPHLAYWGSFSWRGDIVFHKEEHWQRFFTGYRQFILDQAKFAARHKLPMFTVGVELDQTLDRPEWRQIIKEVRAIYQGHLTYAANWDQVASVPFWRQLDSVGVQAYFPLVPPAAADKPVTAATPLPTFAQLAKAWQGVMQQLNTLRQQTKLKQVVFTEIGFDRSPHAASKPWESYGGGPEWAPLRGRLIHAAIRLPQDYPWLAGMFWWKWMPGAEIAGDMKFGGGVVRDGDFSMRDKEARQALVEHWRADSAN